jgi:hypothetical protein
MEYYYKPPEVLIKKLSATIFLSTVMLLLQALVRSARYAGCLLGLAVAEDKRPLFVLGHPKHKG